MSKCISYNLTREAKTSRVIQGIYHRDSFWQDPGSCLGNPWKSLAPYTWMWSGRQCGQSRTYRYEMELRRTHWSLYPPVPAFKPPLWMMQIGRSATGRAYSLQSSTGSGPVIQWGWRWTGWSSRTCRHGCCLLAVCSSTFTTVWVNCNNAWIDKDLLSINMLTRTFPLSKSCANISCNQL